MTHQRIRLAADVYADTDAVCSVTIGVARRQRVFCDPRLATETATIAKAHAAKTGVFLLCYCIMPDHMHMIITPSSSCDIVKYVSGVKSLSTRAAWGHGIRGTFWQKSFWDHFVRSEDAKNDAIHYVMNNPVRAGLVRPGEVYPWAESFLALR